VFGGLFDLPDWTNRISPFFWVPAPFVETTNAEHMIGLSAVAAALIAIAFVRFHRMLLRRPHLISALGQRVDDGGRLR
jgi:ABC-2 type transport system permease protein